MPMQIQYQVIALVLLIGLLIFGFLVPEQIQKRKKAKEIDSIVSGDRVVTKHRAVCRTRAFCHCL